MAHLFDLSIKIHNNEMILPVYESDCDISLTDRLMKMYK